MVISSTNGQILVYSQNKRFETHESESFRNEDEPFVFNATHTWDFKKVGSGWLPR